MVEPIIGNWNHESSRVRGLAGRLKEKGDTIDSSSRLSSMFRVLARDQGRDRKMRLTLFEITNFQPFSVDSLDAF